MVPASAAHSAATSPAAERPPSHTWHSDPELHTASIVPPEDIRPARAVNSDPVPRPPPSAPPEIPHPYPLRTPVRPLLQRLRYRSRAFVHRISVADPTFSAVGSARADSEETEGENDDGTVRAPTFSKTYAAHPKLPVDIYIPPPSASRPGPLPLYVHVAPVSFLRRQPHVWWKRRPRGKASGGGKKSGRGGVSAADVLCSRLARRHGVCVARIAFRSPPRWLFPTQLWDVVGLVQEIVGGAGLPIDRGRVAIGGLGAGASVALGAVQTQELDTVVKAVAAIAPLVDWSLPFSAKATGASSDQQEKRAEANEQQIQQDEQEDQVEQEVQGAQDQVVEYSQQGGQDQQQQDATDRREKKKAGKKDKKDKKKKTKGQKELEADKDESEGQQERRREKQKEKQRPVESRKGTARIYDLMDWSYVPPRYDRADSMLSPAYVSAEKMPPHVFLVGFNDDILCAETGRLAAKLAAERGFTPLREESSWEQNGVRWSQVAAWRQSFFEMTDSKSAKKTGPEKVLESLVDELGQWLWRTVYA